MRACLFTPTHSIFHPCTCKSHNEETLMKIVFVDCGHLSGMGWFMGESVWVSLGQ